MGKKIAVILSGCGFLDGAEVHESVLTLLALDRLGADVKMFAPDKAQADVVNHKAGEPTGGEPRNVLAESARIARGEVDDVKNLKMADFDALVLPGGYGAAKNLCSFATKGADCDVDPEVERVLQETHAAGKPIGAICIAPAVVAKVLGGNKPEMTIGTDADTSKALQSMGADHKDRAVDDICIDERNKIVSTPAYMLAKRISDAASGIEKLCGTVYEMA